MKVNPPEATGLTAIISSVIVCMMCCPHSVRGLTCRLISQISVTFAQHGRKRPEDYRNGGGGGGHRGGGGGGGYSRGGDRYSDRDRDRDRHSDRYRDDRGERGRCTRAEGWWLLVQRAERRT